MMCKFKYKGNHVTDCDVRQSDPRFASADAATTRFDSSMAAVIINAREECEYTAQDRCAFCVDTICAPEKNATDHVKQDSYFRAGKLGSTMLQ